MGPTIFSGTRADDFNTELSQVAMERVFSERRRQVKLGRQNAIPYACEDPNTADVFRMGVLGEEFGEVCTAIIEHQGLEAQLEEYIHTSAVALACAEGLLRKLGVEARSDGMEKSDAPDEHNFVNIEAMADPHLEVLLKARRIYEERGRTRGEMWRGQGWRGALFNMKTCMERIWRAYWAADPDNLDEKAMDDVLDMINYAVFAYIMLEERNRDGNWNYPQ